MYSYLEDKREWPRWEEFSNSLYLRFDPAANKMPIAEWRNVMQIGTIVEYQEEFEKARAKAPCPEP